MSSEQLPFLILPKEAKPAKRNKKRRNGGGLRITLPTRERQEERLAQRFSLLEKTFSDHRTTVHKSADDFSPEDVLVLETVGPVERFLNAVAEIDGLEWLGDFAADDIPAGPGLLLRRERIWEAIDNRQALYCLIQPEGPTGAASPLEALAREKEISRRPSPMEDSL